MRVSKTNDGKIEMDCENGHSKMTVTVVDAVSIHDLLGKLLGRPGPGDVVNPNPAVEPFEGNENINTNQPSEPVFRDDFNNQGHPDIRPNYPDNDYPNTDNIDDTNPGFSELQKKKRKNAKG